MPTHIHITTHPHIYIYTTHTHTHTRLHIHSHQRHRRYGQVAPVPHVDVEEHHADEEEQVEHIDRDSAAHLLCLYAHFHPWKGRFFTSPPHTLSPIPLPTFFAFMLIFIRAKVGFTSPPIPY